MTGGAGKTRRDCWQRNAPLTWETLTTGMGTGFRQLGAAGNGAGSFFSFVAEKRIGLGKGCIPYPIRTTQEVPL